MARADDAQPRRGSRDSPSITPNTPRKQARSRHVVVTIFPPRHTLSIRRLPIRRAALLLLPILAACSALEPEYAGLVVRYREVAPLDRERLVVTVESGRITWYLEGTDMAEVGDGWLSSRELRIPTGGDAELLVALRGRGTGPAASTTVTLPLEVGRRAQVDIFTSGEPPERACEGCAGIARAPIEPVFRPSARDWLYIRWMGTVTAVGGPSPAVSSPTRTTGSSNDGP